MHSPETINRFLELRAQGWTLVRLAEHLQISERTLVDWNRQHRAELRARRAAVLEAVQDKILPTYEQEITRLAAQLNRIEEKLAQSDFSSLSTRDLFTLARQLRAEIGEIRVHVEEALEATPVPSSEPSA